MVKIAEFVCDVWAPVVVSVFCFLAAGCCVSSALLSHLERLEVVGDNPQLLLQLEDL